MSIDYEQSCWYRVNDGDYKSSRVDKDWHLASITASRFAKNELGDEFSGEAKVEICTDNESRTYQVKGFYVYKTTSNEVRKSRKAY